MEAINTRTCTKLNDTGIMAMLLHYLHGRSWVEWARRAAPPAPWSEWAPPSNINSRGHPGLSVVAFPGQPSVVKNISTLRKKTVQKS